MTCSRLPRFSVRSWIRDLTRYEGTRMKVKLECGINLRSITLASVAVRNMRSMHNKKKRKPLQQRSATAAFTAFFKPVYYWRVMMYLPTYLRCIEIEINVRFCVSSSRSLRRTRKWSCSLIFFFYPLNNFTLCAMPQWEKEILRDDGCARCWKLMRRQSKTGAIVWNSPQGILECIIDRNFIFYFFLHELSN